MTRPARVSFSPAAVRANLEVVRKLAPASKVLAIVKADGYGHGIVRMARALSAVDALGVASIEEAVRLREAGIELPIVLLEGPFEASELAEITRYRLESVVHSAEQLAWFSQYEDRAPLWVKIDTGMHRLGFAPEDVPAVLGTLAANDRSVRVMTHFHSAHLAGSGSVPTQLAEFLRTVQGAKVEHCLANSSAILQWPQTRCDWIRPGLLLYGVSPLAHAVAGELGLQPAMTVSSALISVKEVPAGGTLGYGGTWRCPERMRVGVVAFGYADGYPRHAGTGTPILVNGVLTQVLGEPTMDMLLVDLRRVPAARVGDPVVLWGDGLPVEEVARHAGTIPYELLCRMRMRAPVVEVAR